MAVKWGAVLSAVQICINPTGQTLVTRQVYKSRITAHPKDSLLAANMFSHMREGIQ